MVWSYSGVRPLYDDGAENASAATRDYTLKVDTNGAPVLNIFGGKITTYRRLAEEAMDLVGAHLDGAKAPWTAGAPLPGGDFPVDDVLKLITELKFKYPFLDILWAQRLVRAYGTEADTMLAGAERMEDLGKHFGETLTAREVQWLMDHEFAQTAEDVIWRRTKLGLRMRQGEIDALETWMTKRRVGASPKLTPAAE